MLFGQRKIEFKISTFSIFIKIENFKKKVGIIHPGLSLREMQARKRLNPRERRDKALVDVEEKERRDYVENFVRLFDDMKGVIDPLINQRIRIIDEIFEDPERTFNDPKLVELEKKTAILGRPARKKEGAEDADTRGKC